MSKPKILIIEPNLKNEFGHPFSVMQSIFNDRRNIYGDVIFVGHKSADLNIRRKFSLVPCTTANFENHNSIEVKKYLSTLINRFRLDAKDWVIFTTAHLNELQGLKSISKKFPKLNFFAQIHQFLPSVKDTLKLPKGIEDKIAKSFTVALKGIPDNLIVSTTENANLKNKLKKFHKNIISLPIPNNTALIRPRMRARGKQVIVGFFGDNRKEKGLLTILKLINSTNFHQVKFTLQVTKPKYYGEDLKKFYSQLEQASVNKNVLIVNGPMSASAYYSRLRSCNVLLLPYDPHIYSDRFSGIAQEAQLLKIPVISYKNNSIGESIRSGSMLGITISFSTDSNLNVVNLAKAIQKFKKVRIFPKFVPPSIIKGSNYINEILCLQKS